MIDRRGFIGASVAGGLGAVAAVSGCASDGDSAGAGAGEEAGATAVPPFELDEATVDQLQASMASGERTARSIAEMYLERIEALDGQGPALRSIIETNPDALAIADELDAERAAGNVRGPLHGIPVALKDNLDTHDRMTTTAGSLALEGSVPPQDSFIAARLREAGAVILAKANLSEWAYFRGIRATSGWSARGGQCRNPYALDRNPCGSSSGSGVAASANLCALTVGTETGGSIMCPSSSNGIVGIKPTVGLWSRAGVIPISHSQDTAGPMCRTVRDAAILLGACIGVDPRDSATAGSEGRGHADYTQFLDPAGLQGARIGVVRSFPGFDPRVLALFDEAVEAMRAEGAVIIDSANMDAAAWNDPLSLVLLEYEFKADLNAYLAGLGPDAPVKSLAEVIDFNERNADREMQHFGQERLIASQARGPLTDPEYLNAKATIQQANREDGIDRLAREHGLDAIIAPTRDLPWPTDHIKGDRLDGGSSAAPAAIAGYPDITVPMGFVKGLPTGVSFFGPAWTEPTLLRIAYAYEQATQQRRAPTFATTLG
ncbi:amidase [Candidatus Palauibacter polyketidifaciens]|uniref:amidase n=1 Tax=Candidatus Palauibacter polyketidifaciens TaxID=3056740 RepID=UPI0023930C89|nr:amidase [Candidatus Palauibacter polyketidifaciens]MDE2720977.1 amidase [Candidatus Palauibacter polyketidifaciens]